MMQDLERAAGVDAKALTHVAAFHISRFRGFL